MPRKLTAAEHLQSYRVDVSAGKVLSPGELLIVGDRITEAGTAVTHPAGAQIVDLGRRLNMALVNKVEELAQYRSEFFGRLREVLPTDESLESVFAYLVAN